jgi:uncharacterized membrane protein
MADGTGGAQRSRRLESIDALRGIVMILMALDHVRDYVGVPANPTDPATASVALFFTRWVTHLCAPTFFLLTGVGAWLRGHRGTVPREIKGASSLRRELSWFLLTRGAWLIVLELTVVRCLGYQFNFDYRVTMLVILWALGWAMIVLAGLVYVPTPAVMAFGVVLIALHDLFDPVTAASLGAFGPIWLILHAPGVVIARPEFVVFVAYPIVPWIGVTAAGYGLGQVFGWVPGRRRRFLLTLGLTLSVGFLVLRAINGYGNPLPWTVQLTGVRTVLSFLNANKYPPSLLYLLMTLGPATLILWMLDAATPRWMRAALVFGRVPLFYFLLHLPLIHLLAVGACYARYGVVHWMFESPSLDKYPVTFPPGWGYELAGVYLVWIIVVVSLYPLCRWFADVRRQRSDWWLSYL